MLGDGTAAEVLIAEPAYVADDALSLRGAVTAIAFQHAGG